VHQRTLVEWNPCIFGIFHSPTLFSVTHLKSTHPPIHSLTQQKPLTHPSIQKKPFANPAIQNPHSHTESHTHPNHTLPTHPLPCNQSLPSVLIYDQLHLQQFIRYHTVNKLTVNTLFQYSHGFKGSLHDLTGIMMDHRSLPPVFKSRPGHIWRVFGLAHLAYHVHKSGHKTSIIIIINHHMVLNIKNDLW